MILEIDRLGHRGDGIGTGPEGPVFVARTLPGEIVEGNLCGDRLFDVKIIVPSPARVSPPCPHARSCGGCLLQHATDTFVSEWKLDLVRAALEGQGLEAPLRPIVISPPRSRRRATLAGRRTKSGALIGFHARASDIIVPVAQCHLLHPDLLAALPALEALVIAGGSRSAELALTMTHSRGGTDVAVTGGKEGDPALMMDLARIAETFGLARLTWGGTTVSLRAIPVQQLGQARVVLPPGAFLQATADGEAAIVAAVREAVGAARRVVDLFAGAGTFTLPLAETAEVHAVEADPAMLSALDKAWRATPGLHRVTTEARDLFRRPLEPDEFRGIGAVVIDPPRAGAEMQAAALGAAQVPLIAAVSCNPFTFARDARVLASHGYRLDWIQTIDQFRWSAHVELAARFSLQR